MFFSHVYLLTTELVCRVGPLQMLHQVSSAEGARAAAALEAAPRRPAARWRAAGRAGRLPAGQVSPWNLIDLQEQQSLADVYVPVVLAHIRGHIEAGALSSERYLMRTMEAMPHCTLYQLIMNNSGSPKICRWQDRSLSEGCDTDPNHNPWRECLR